MVKIKTVLPKIQVSTPQYTWEWNADTDLVCLHDKNHRLISRAQHRPLPITSPTQLDLSESTYEIRDAEVRITYRGQNPASSLTVVWSFHPDFISLEPLLLSLPADIDLVRIVYFPIIENDSYKPSMYSHYAVVPGLTMSTNISPIVDLHSRLNTTAVLGSGAMRGPGLTQQWGLPAHYFCTFNTSDRWNAIGAKAEQSEAACWGLASLPQGDFRLEIREIGISPILNLRTDLWKHKPDTFGFHFLITFGENYHEASRKYYQVLQREKFISLKKHSPKKQEVLLAPQYNTWGVESALALPPERLTEDLVRDIFGKYQCSGMQAKTFVIDDKWEGVYGELKHDPDRFPNFEKLLEDIRAQGYNIGLWAAFLRCQNPTALGLDESHLLQTHEGKTLWLDHQTSRYGIFDMTQPKVQEVLRQRAKDFIRRYKPDLIKFDFGYELPSLDVAAPQDMTFAGERLLQKGLEVIVGAMKEENPDLVIMYYGLSPLLIDYYDLHSPDDLVYCIGDYDLETNRRIFFSSLCGELGMPTYSSSGYDWDSAIDIWFDSVASGSLGSLHCFDGDENGEKPSAKHIAKFNGINSLVRKEAQFTTKPVHAKWQGGLRAGFSPSWERIENG
ncbi:MAG: TIM-barrel domain-containing protein, partial [Anaerolineae bacterium]